ncbi:hypothetical protein [Gemmatimonas sp.]|uniref:hypothetical protein n=1 Tax=Gemmatimonas sp. TaxID=1962908 RepID=UPI0039834B7C
MHIRAGITALVLAKELGPRRDFTCIPTVPHNVPFALLGAGMLWFGWCGFNAGSALAAPVSVFVLHYRARTSLDDTHDVFACHGVAGIMGAVLTGVFASLRM